MSPTDSILFVVFLSLAATATAQVARNVRIEGQQFIETKVLTQVMPLEASKSNHAHLQDG